ncbi:MAG: serine/threonine-protein kinase [Verrucomicrobiales bacterium]
MPDPLTCEDCGAPIPRSSPGGVCPACLAAELLADGEASSAPGAAADLPVPGYVLRESWAKAGSGSSGGRRNWRGRGGSVAIKFLKPGLERGEAGVRFEAEMAALALMDHPGIARVFASGKARDGSPYFAMEFIEGEPINRFCKARDLPLRERLALFVEVCEAVAHAHRRGIIHRDLKPSNILVPTAPGAPPVPKVIDFGIAKATERLLTDRTLVTSPVQVLGTPAYMAPEQAELRGEAIDTRSDVYSLGAVLYELLAGSTPFKEDTAGSTPYDEVLRRIREDDLARPGARAPVRQYS